MEQRRLAPVLVLDGAGQVDHLPVGQRQVRAVGRRVVEPLAKSINMLSCNGLPAFLHDHPLVVPPVSDPMSGGHESRLRMERGSCRRQGRTELPRSANWASGATAGVWIGFWWVTTATHGKPLDTSVCA